MWTTASRAPLCHCHSWCSQLQQKLVFFRESKPLKKYEKSSKNIYFDFWGSGWLNDLWNNIHFLLTKKKKKIFETNALNIYIYIYLRLQDTRKRNFNSLRTWPFKQLLYLYRGLTTLENLKINKRIITFFEGFPTLKKKNFFFF